MQQMFKGIIFVFILLCTITDIKEKRIYWWMILVFLPFFLLYGISWGKSEPYEWVQDLAPGAFLLFVGVIWKEQIGIGDGIFVFMMGMVWDVRFLMVSIISALLLLAFLGGCLMLAGKIDKKEKMPFVPFMALGIAGNILYGIYGNV